MKIKTWGKLAACFLLTVLIGITLPAIAEDSSHASTLDALTQLEAASGGRLGVSIIDTGTGARIDYRAQERFPFCSTGKVMVAAAHLKRGMTDHHWLQRTITYQASDLVVHSPVTQTQVGKGMSIAELCQATLTQTDNTAMNLLVQELGGPQVITQFARTLGDTAFRLDRLEPALTSAIPGDLRDTTTPSAMANSLQQLVLGSTLDAPLRLQLQRWLIGNTTGQKRIRAGVPKGWLVGDKTGSGKYGTTNDIAVIWPPKRAPLVIAIYFTQPSKEAAPNEEVVAAATRIVVRGFLDNKNTG